MKIASIKNFILNTLFPPLCLSCRNHLKPKETRVFVCQKCQETIRISNRVNTLRFEEIGNIKFGATTSYKNKTIKSIIHSLKYENLISAKYPIQILIRGYLERSDFVEELKGKSWLILPVPIHKSKKAERSFNQAKVIANIFKKELNKNGVESHLSINTIAKIKNTKPQAQLSFKERSQNVRESMEIKTPSSFKNKNIVIVDDVLTSGSTVREILRLLKNTGAKDVNVFTIAKT